MQWISFELVKITQLNSSLNSCKHLKTFVFFTPEVFDMLVNEVFCERQLITKMASFSTAVIFLGYFWEQYIFFWKRTPHYPMVNFSHICLPMDILQIRNMLYSICKHSNRWTNIPLKQAYWLSQLGIGHIAIVHERHYANI